MKAELLEASLFRPLSKEVRDVLLASDVLPVNDVFVPMTGNNELKLILLYGSYGSGKSIYVADMQIEKARSWEYHRCYFGRKILDTVRGSIFKTIIDRIEERNLGHEFSFSKHPTGTMVIRHRETGNEMFPFGANNPGSLKSIKDPTDFVCEEFDQFTQEDFGPIYSRLRTEKAPTQFWGMFNTERLFKSHWVRQFFFDGEYATQAYKLKCNYTDNAFIDQADYYEKLKLIANGNIAVLNAIANGEFGMVRTGGELWKSFNESFHVKQLHYIPGAIWCSLDDNVVPYVTNTIWQVRGKQLCMISEIAAEEPNNNAPRAAGLFCDYLDGIGHRDLVIVCGDPSSSKRSTVDANSASFYDKFLEILRLRGYKAVNKVMRSAPEVALSATFINEIFANQLNGNQILIGDGCFKAIEDLIMAKEDAEGRGIKEKAVDKVTGQTYEIRLHFSDAIRYFVLTVLAAEFEKYKGRRSNLRAVASILR
jgi:hypothetical protein